MLCYVGTQLPQHVVSVWSKRQKGAGCGCWYRRDFRLITRTLNLSTAGVNLFAGAVGKVSIPLYRPPTAKPRRCPQLTYISAPHRGAITQESIYKYRDGDARKTGLPDDPHPVHPGGAAPSPHCPGTSLVFLSTRFWTK